MSKSQFKRANAMAAADIIDGGYCKYGSASKSDNSEKYCKQPTTNTLINRLNAQAQPKLTVKP